MKHRMLFAAAGTTLLSTLAWTSTVSAQAQAPARPAAVPAQAPARVVPAQAPPATAALAPAQPGAVQTTLLTDRPEDEQALRAMLRTFIEAYNAQKAEDLGKFLLDDTMLIDADGQERAGKDPIIAEYAAVFAAGPTDKFQGTIDGLRFLGNDTASIRGDFQLVGDDGTPSVGGRYGITAVRGPDQQWKIAEIRDHAVSMAVSGSNYEYLQALDWMLGDWVDESEGVKLSTNVRWMDDSKNYLVRTFDVEIGGEKGSSGAQYIGYDPRSGQIRSWVFDSEGGFSEGTWTQGEDGGWIINATGVTRDGDLTSAIQTISYVNNDSVRLGSINRLVGGEAQIDIPEVIMVRKPPAPATPAETPASR